MKTIAIKIGSGTLITKRSKLDEYRLAHIAEQIALIHKNGVAVVLVVSGAVACGIKHCGAFSCDDLLKRQIAAGIGQVELIAIIRKVFASKRITVAQVLLSPHQLEDAAQRACIKSVLEQYLQSGIVAIVNENDAASLNGFQGNDLLVVEVARLVNAEQVLMLSQMARSAHGVGGVETKIQARHLLAQAGITSAILNGKDKNVIINNIAYECNY